MIASARAVYIVNSFWILDIDNKLLQLGGSIEGESRKWNLFPKRSQDVGLEGSMAGTVFAMLGQVGDDVTRHIMRNGNLTV